MTKIYVLVALMSSLLASSAHAGLGEYESHVSQDSSVLKSAKVTRKASTLYSVQELASAGSTVREYANSDGIVFAVTWKGISTPDLPTILGSYYAEYAAAQEQTIKSSTSRRQQSIIGNNVVVRRAGHMRAWRGRALVASLVPAGVDAETLP